MPEEKKEAVKAGVATVTLLDGKILDVPADRKWKCEKIFDSVCEHLDLLEKDYFGLNFYDKSGRKTWLDLEKRVGKIFKGDGFKLNFEVKFYPKEPSQLQEDFTRYLLCLQVRNDILSGKLPCSFVVQAMLGSYLVQSQLGDYNPEEYPDASYLEGFKFAPVHSEGIEERVMTLHKTHKGQTPAEAEQHYLENAKKLSLYGVDMHPAKDSEDVDIEIGICSTGILVYQGMLKVNRFAWPKILKISYRRNNFYIKIRPGEFEQYEQTIGFKLDSSRTAKNLWKVCVDQHTFFRLTSADGSKRPALLFPRLGSLYRWQRKTQVEVMGSIPQRGSQNFTRSLSLRPLTSRSMDGLGDISESEDGQKRHTMPHQLNRSPRKDTKKPAGGVAVLPVTPIKKKDKDSHTNGVSPNDEEEKENRSLDKKSILSDQKSLDKTKKQEQISGLFDISKKSKDKSSKKKIAEAVAVSDPKFSSKNEKSPDSKSPKKDKSQDSKSSKNEKSSDSQNIDANPYTKVYEYTVNEDSDAKKSKNIEGFSYEADKVSPKKSTDENRSPVSPGRTEKATAFNYAPGDVKKIEEVSNTGSKKTGIFSLFGKKKDDKSDTLDKKLESSGNIEQSKKISTSSENVEESKAQKLADSSKLESSEDLGSEKSKKSLKLSRLGKSSSKEDSKKSQEDDEKSKKSQRDDEKSKKSQKASADDLEKSGTEKSKKSSKLLGKSSSPEQEGGDEKSSSIGKSKKSHKSFFGKSSSPEQGEDSEKSGAEKSSKKSSKSPFGKSVSSSPATEGEDEKSAEKSKKGSKSLLGFGKSGSEQPSDSDKSGTEKSKKSSKSLFGKLTSSPGQDEDTEKSKKSVPGKLDGSESEKGDKSKKSLSTIFGTKDSGETKKSIFGSKSSPDDKAKTKKDAENEKTKKSKTSDKGHRDSKSDISTQEEFLQAERSLSYEEEEVSRKPKIVTEISENAPKIVKTTTKSKIVGSGGTLTQNVEESIEDVNTGEVTRSTHLNTAEGLEDSHGSPYVLATAVTTRTATTHEDLGTNAKTSQVEEKTVAQSTKTIGHLQEQRVVHQEVRATTVVNDPTLKRAGSTSSVSSDDSGTPIDGDPSQTYFVEKAQGPIVETETVVYEPVGSTAGALVLPVGGDQNQSGDEIFGVPGAIVTSQTITSKTRTVETLTYKTEKDGVVETRVEQKITIQSDGDPVDHEKALNEAIQEATAMNPDMRVEKIEIQQEAAP